VRIGVALARPGFQEVLELDLPEGSTVADAILAANLPARWPGVEPGALTAGIWSRECAVTTPLREGDRVELYRALRADAKAQRRARAGAGRGRR
jgi:uncharacterized protein